MPPNLFGGGEVRASMVEVGCDVKLKLREKMNKIMLGKIVTLIVLCLIVGCEYVSEYSSSPISSQPNIHIVDFHVRNIVTHYIPPHGYVDTEFRREYVITLSNSGDVDGEATLRIEEKGRGIVPSIQGDRKCINEFTAIVGARASSVMSTFKCGIKPR